MSIKDRKTLKNLFGKGRLPSENSFSDMIDSSINKIDDGFSKSIEDGLMLSPTGDSERVLSIFDKITDVLPSWTVNLFKKSNDEKTEKSLNFKSANNIEPLLTLTENQQIGINNKQPKHTLDVKGYSASKGVIGNASVSNEIPADRQWHNILENLNYCTAFEVVARVGVVNTGKHALLRAIVMSAYGNSSNKIKCLHARYTLWRRLRIKLRWVGSTYNYALQMKCSKNLGNGAVVRFHVKQLWDDLEMGEPAHYDKNSNLM
jgi:hypothetical protein